MLFRVDPDGIRLQDILEELYMTRPIPNISQMLEIAEACGLTTLEDAYQNYISHYDMFFYIPEYCEQLHAFTIELKEKGLTEVFEGESLLLLNISISEAKNLVSDFKRGYTPHVLHFDESPFLG